MFSVLTCSDADPTRGTAAPGGEKMKLNVAVHNKGRRDLASLTGSVFRAFKNGKAELLTVKGPFPAGSSRSVEAFNVVGNNPGRKTIKVRRATY